MLNSTHGHITLAKTDRLSISAKFKRNGAQLSTYGKILRVSKMYISLPCGAFILGVIYELKSPSSPKT